MHSLKKKKVSFEIPGLGEMEKNSRKLREFM